MKTRLSSDLFLKNKIQNKTLTTQKKHEIHNSLNYDHSVKTCVLGRMDGRI